MFFRKLCRLAPLVLWLGVCLGLTACFEPPVLETLDLRFLADGSVVVTSAVRISALGEENNPALARRLAQVRRELEEGSDAWGNRFAALEPVAERFGWEKRFGQIDRGTRSAPAPISERCSPTFWTMEPGKPSRRSPIRNASGSPGSTKPWKRS